MQCMSFSPDPPPSCYCVPRVAAMLRADSGRARPIRECIAEARDMIREDPSLHECDAYVIDRVARLVADDREILDRLA